jgi:hypothetical protein
MKDRFQRIVCLLAVIGFTAAGAFGDEKTTVLEDRVLDTFDGDSAYEWRTAASRFATRSETDGNFPKVSYAASVPLAIRRINRDAENPMSLGLWGRFDRKGYNWIDIYPVKKPDGGGAAAADAPPFEIPIPGRAKSIDAWVWGSNYNYYLEAYVRDYQGIVHTIYMGNIAYEGWKNLMAPIPGSIPQIKRYLPRLTGLTFVKFRLWTVPNELVDNFYVYIDHLKVLTDTYESIYDGDDLVDDEFIQKTWNSTN